ncbi:MAG: hypothetical protein WBA10_12500 [Elainellaceae cyanobacterium]
MTPWQKLRNAYLNLSTYADLSPDLSCRQQVCQALKSRPLLNRHDWCHTLWSGAYSAKILAFVYDYLPQYSGLTAGTLRPDDHLEADLSWPHICGFDWDAELCDDFQKMFGYDISDHLIGAPLNTLEDLVICLHQQTPH